MSDLSKKLVLVCDVVRPRLLTSENKMAQRSAPYLLPLLRYEFYELSFLLLALIFRLRLQ